LVTTTWTVSLLPTANDGTVKTMPSGGVAVKVLEPPSFSVPRSTVMVCLLLLASAVRFAGSVALS
jgi:hypothetical protein